MPPKKQDNNTSNNSKSSGSNLHSKDPQPSDMSLKPLSISTWDLLSLTASDLQRLLTDGRISSVELVKASLDQIQKHNLEGLKLRALISTPPQKQVLSHASLLDQERKTGIGGPLHGIPVIVKDTIATPSQSMDTTCGSFALKGARTSKDAAIVDKLLKAGMILLGKANLSELGALKGWCLTAGWSAVGGQTQSPYVVGGVLPNATFSGHSTPSGSSAGSAVGVAAGFAPIAIGTETDGSIIQPANRAGLYGLKLTPGMADATGICGVSPPFDSIGGFAKSPQDLADLITVILDGKDFSSSLTRSWEGIRVGFVDPDLWTLDPFMLEPNDEFRAQASEEMEAAVSKIRAAGGVVTQPVPLITLEEVFKDPRGVRDIDDLIFRDTRRSFESFFQLFETQENVRTIEDLVEFNKRHADVELPPHHPGQEALEAVIKSKMTDEEYECGLKLMRETVSGFVEATFAEYQIDAIMGPADSLMTSVAAAAGFPAANVPLGYAKFNGRAFGMIIIAGRGQEGKLLQVMSAWENTFPKARQPPPQLVNWD